MVYRGIGGWGNGEMGHLGYIPGDVPHYLMCHFRFIAVSQYDSQCPSFHGLWTVDAQWNSENGIT